MTQFTAASNGRDKRWRNDTKSTSRVDFSSSPDRFGWAERIGSIGYSDPNENLIGIPVTQRMMEPPLVPLNIMPSFWTLTYQTVKV